MFTSTGKVDPGSGPSGAPTGQGIVLPKPASKRSGEDVVTDAMDVDKRPRIAYSTVGFDEAELNGLTKWIESADQAIRSLGLSSTTTQQKVWSSEYVGEKLHIAILPTAAGKELSPVEATMLYLIKLLKSEVTLTHAGSASFDPKTLSQGSKEFLAGIIGAFTTFERATLAPITSQTRVVESTMRAIWILSATHLVNDKNKRGSIRSSVVTNLRVGGRPAGDYIESQIKAINATLGSDQSFVGETLHRLIKKMALHMSEQTADMVKALRVPWSEMAEQAIPHTTTSTGKGRAKRTTRSQKIPLNPKKNAFLSNKERTEISHLMKDKWEVLAKIQEAWGKKTPQKTHDDFDAVRDQIRDALKNMQQATDTIGRRLGHRKAIIDGFEAANKGLFKKAKNAIERASVFYNSPLVKTMNSRAKRVFAPFYYLGEQYPGMEKFTKIWQEDNVLSSVRSKFVTDEDLKTGHLIHINKLWCAWIDMFEPTEINIGTAVDQIDLSNFNPFALLAPEKQGEKSKDMET